MRYAQMENGAETESNEMELLEFKLGDSSYGIEIGKIRELLQYQPVKKMPGTPDCLEGIICPRGEIYAVVDLAAYLQVPSSQKQEQDILIITDDRKNITAFHVHGVVGIHHISLDAIEKPGTLFSGDAAVITGIVKVDKRLVAIVNFEKIIAILRPQFAMEAAN